MVSWILILLIIGLMPTVIAVMVFVSVIRPSKMISTKKPTDYGIEYEQLILITKDNLRLSAWFLPNPTSRTVIIIGHGYPFDKGSILANTKFLHKHNNLIYFDFRYFGTSQGNYTTFGVKERLDVQAVLDYIESHPDLDAQQVALLGYSFSATAFIIANPKPARAMVLVSPFSSIESMTKDTFHSLIGPLKGLMVYLSKLYGQWFLGVSFDDASALAAVEQLHMPVLFIHGKKDHKVPVWHSEQLYAKCQSKDKSLWLLPEIGHNIGIALRKEEYQEKIEAFLTEDRSTNEF